MLRLAAILLALASANACAGEFTVAVAANLSAPVQRLAANFQLEQKHDPIVVTGSTGKLYAQVKNGAPFDLLLAADESTPARLESEGLAVPGSRFTLAMGRLALWSADTQRVDAAGRVLRAKPNVKLAIADPKLAPYGAAAMQVLDKLGVAAAWRPQLVIGENIAQAHQFAATGNAALGFVALSDVMVDGRIPRGSAWVVPQELYTPLKQDAVLLAHGKDNAAAKAFAAYLRTEPARTMLRGYGYTF